MAKETIRSFNDFMKIAVEKTYGEKYDLSKELWDSVLRRRFENSPQIFDYDDEKLTDVFDLSDVFSNMNRLDDYIRYEKDAGKKISAMATRRVVSAAMDDLLNKYTFSAVQGVYDQIEKAYNIPEEVKEEYRKASQRYLAENTERDENIPADELSLEQLNDKEKISLFNSLMSSFIDRDAWKDNEGKVVGQTKSAGEALDKINKTAKKMLDDARLHKLADYTDEREKEEIAELGFILDNQELEQINRHRKTIENNKTVSGLSNMDISQLMDEAHLEFDPSPYARISANGFIAKQKENDLSGIETNWAVSNIDRMVNSLYTKDELKKLGEAGIDPAIGILVDGKPLDWFKLFKEDPDIRKFAPDIQLQTTQKKCEIASKALQGKKIDICKVGVDNEGKIELGKTIPVKTDLSEKIKSRTRSFFRWIMEMFGFLSTTREKIKSANEADRDYRQISGQKDALKKDINEFAQSINKTKAPENPYATIHATVKNEKTGKYENRALDAHRKWITDYARSKESAHNYYNRQYERDFFGESFPTDEQSAKKFDNGVNEIKLEEAFMYTDAQGANAKAIGTLGRIGTNNSFAFYYGLSKGYTMEEMMDPDNTELRKTIGRDLIKDLGVDTYDKFLMSKGFEDNKNNQQLYGEYLMERKNRLENFYVEAFGKLKEVPMPIVSPYNTGEFIKKYPIIDTLGTMAQDFYQMFNALGINWLECRNESGRKLDFGLDEIDKKALQKSNDRAAAVYEHVSNLVDPIGKINGIVGKYFEFLQKDEYAAKECEFTQLEVKRAARFKSVLQFFSENLKENATIGDCMNDSDLYYSPVAMFWAINNDSDLIIDMENPEIASKNRHYSLEHCILNDNPHTSNIKVNFESKKFEERTMGYDTKLNQFSETDHTLAFNSDFNNCINKFNSSKNKVMKVLEPFMEGDNNDFLKAHANAVKQMEAERDAERGHEQLKDFFAEEPTRKLVSFDDITGKAKQTSNTDSKAVGDRVRCENKGKQTSNTDSKEHTPEKQL